MWDWAQVGRDRCDQERLGRNDHTVTSGSACACFTAVGQGQVALLFPQPLRLATVGSRQLWQSLAEDATGASRVAAKQLAHLQVDHDGNARPRQVGQPAHMAAVYRTRWLRTEWTSVGWLCR